MDRVSILSVRVEYLFCVSFFKKSQGNLLIILFQLTKFELRISHLVNCTPCEELVPIVRQYVTFGKCEICARSISIIFFFFFGGGGVKFVLKFHFHILACEDSAHMCRTCEELACYY